MPDQHDGLPAAGSTAAGSPAEPAPTASRPEPIDRRRAIELLHGLVAIRSHSREEAEASRWLVTSMQRFGYPRAYIDEAGNAVGETGALDSPHVVVLLGHIDTVPGNIPVRVEATPGGEVLYGRGSVDAKGPLAALVAGASRVEDALRHANLRLVVVGAVEEEAATSKGARHVAARFDGRREPIPLACVIGEPSHWSRITLGYKGRLLLDVHAQQPMAHTAGPDAGVASSVVDIWNWTTAHASAWNVGRERVFDWLSPSLRRVVTSTTPDMMETVEAQLAWRLPEDFDAPRLSRDLIAWTAGTLGVAVPQEASDEDVCHGAFTLRATPLTVSLQFRGFERPWRSDRQNALVRSFLAAIRAHDASVQPRFVVKTGTSDMNVVAPIWRCPIVAYGPGDSALDHTPHEHVSLDEFWRAVLIVEEMLRAFAGSRQ